MADYWAISLYPTWDRARYSSRLVGPGIDRKASGGPVRSQLGPRGWSTRNNVSASQGKLNGHDTPKRVVRRLYAGQLDLVFDQGCLPRP